MSTFQTIMQSDSKISDLESSINEALSDKTLASIDKVEIDYENSKNRISVFYIPGSSSNGYANDFEVVTGANSSISDLLAQINSDMSEQQSTDPQLCPSTIDFFYGDNKHRGVVAMAPSSISGQNPSLLYCVVSLSNSNIDDLETSVNEYLNSAAENNLTVLDLSYYYGNSKNRCVILYSTTSS